MNPALPIDAVLPRLSEELKRRNSLVLVAEPGAGKTTRVPLALLDTDWAKAGKIVMLEPRRIAARAAARRMAATLGETVGETVGYAVRHERRISARTRIEVVTEGLLTRRLQADAAISDAAMLIFDEFHERTLDGDLALALALDAQNGLRSDLKLLVMSATLDAARLSAYLGDAPVISAPGRVFPVTTHYGMRPPASSLVEPMSRTIAQAVREQDGSVLAFLPGEAEIRRTATLLNEIKLPQDIDILPLYGAMPGEAQDAAIRPSPAGRRKIVLATTIAETSLTIDGITTVVDCGYKRRPRFDPASGMTRLETVRVSVAAAEQRRGRAGRLGPGICYRLWPEAEDRALVPFDPPEIFEADLAQLALELAAWGVADPAQLSWLDPPPRAAFEQARELLQNLDAVDDAGLITETGSAMASLPLHPRLAHMVVAGKRLSAGSLAADLAALLSERDILERGADADLVSRIEALRGERAIANRGVKERVRDAARQIRALARLGEDGDAASVGLLVASAWPDRIAQKRGGRGRFRMMGGGGAALPEHDALAGEDYLAIATTDGKSGDQRIYLAAKLSKDEIVSHFAGHMRTNDIIAWEGRSGAVTARRQRRLGALILDEMPLPAAHPERLADAMLIGIRQMGLESLSWSEADQRLRARVAFLKRHLPDQDWPDLSDEALLSQLDVWLKPYLAGMTRVQHLERLDLHQILRSLIPPSLQRRLDELAPARIAIPSGAELTIDYDRDGGPVLRARLQEMFGLVKTPRIADGRVPLRLELLSPAGRPLAVTQSLETFWTNAYPQVRAEMRGRYPKHVWPEDPRDAVPVKPGKSDEKGSEPVTDAKIDDIAAQFSTVRDLLRYAVSRFAAAGIFHGHGTSSGLDEAAFIILECLHLPVDDINPWLDARLLADERRAILVLIERRIATRKPAAYLLGHTYIQGVRLRADERAIVPRSYIGEILFSEHFTGELPLLGDHDAVTRVLDLCTGSGSLAILAAKVFPQALIDAVDLSPEALALAHLNVEDHGLTDRVRLLQGDLYLPLGKTRYDLILSNPPYVDAQGMESLPQEYRHEPPLALDGGEDGISIVQRIADEAADHLNPGGGILCEVGRCREALEIAYPDLDFLWIDTEESAGEVFWLTHEQLEG